MWKVKGLPEKMYLSGVSLLIAPFFSMWFELPNSSEAYYPAIIVLLFIVLVSLSQTVVFFLLKLSTGYRWFYGLSQLTIICLILVHSPAKSVLLISSVLYVVNGLVIGFLLPRVKE
ncbi:hypothetical protein CGK39_23700 [Vibrio parahaemolyticus]|uniref:hypothetical protein n=1 Tax=Vibrio parahaemolyticus TaxID=670 RepID=UPI00112019B5|nr:hypothetical protein [Vibrio parahaemolyticus]TNZ79718.1 hypothetical protein CGK39_23700 [Vibrio parahaemolyticus]